MKFKKIFAAEVRGSFQIGFLDKICPEAAVDAPETRHANQWKI